MEIFITCTGRRTYYVMIKAQITLYSADTRCAASTVLVTTKRFIVKVVFKCYEYHIKLPVKPGSSCVNCFVCLT